MYLKCINCAPIPETTTGPAPTGPQPSWEALQGEPAGHVCSVVHLGRHKPISSRGAVNGGFIGKYGEIYEKYRGNYGKLLGNIWGNIYIVFQGISTENMAWNMILTYTNVPPF